MRAPWRRLVPKDRDEARRAVHQAALESREAEKLNEQSRQLKQRFADERFRNHFAEMIMRAYALRRGR